MSRRAPKRHALRKRYARAKAGTVKVENLRVIAEVDQDPDLSYLTGGGDPEYAEEDRKRYEAYGDRWHMIGIRAAADVTIAGTVQHIQSAGLWGIESDSGKAYFKEVAKEEYKALVDILRAMGAKKIPSLASAEWVDR
jgi:hypothetical protein